MLAREEKGPADVQEAALLSEWIQSRLWSSERALFGHQQTQGMEGLLLVILEQ